MKKLLIVSLLVIHGFTSAAEAPIMVNLHFNSQLPGLENVVRAEINVIRAYDTNTGSLGDIVFSESFSESEYEGVPPIILAPDETHQIELPALGTYIVNADFLDADGNTLNEFEGGAPENSLINVSESGQTFDLAFVPKESEQDIFVPEESPEAEAALSQEPLAAIAASIAVQGQSEQEVKSAAQPEEPHLPEEE